MQGFSLGTKLFDQYQIDFSFSAICHHPLEFTHPLIVSSGRLVGIHADKYPTRAAADPLCKILLLGFQAMMLFFLLRAYPTVCSNVFPLDEQAARYARIYFDIFH